MAGIVLTEVMTELSVEPQQDEAEVFNPTVARMEKQTGSKNVNMPQSKHDGRLKIIWTRSG